MIEYFTAPGSAPFTVALLVMFGLLLLELVSLINGLGANEMVDEFIIDHVDLPDGSATGLEGSATIEGGSAVGRLLAWLHIGKVPVLMVLIVFLTVFGLLGLMAQSLLRQTIGWAVPGAIAAPAVLLLSLPLVRACTGGLARVLPKEETSAVSTASFIGRTAVIVGGDARRNLPAQARFTDRFGTTHYVLVEPEDSHEILPRGSIVLLVQRLDGSRFSAIPNPNAALTDDP